MNRAGMRATAVIGRGWMGAPSYALWRDCPRMDVCSGEANEPFRLAGTNHHVTQFDTLYFRPLHLSWLSLN